MSVQLGSEGLAARQAHRMVGQVRVVVLLGLCCWAHEAGQPNQGNLISMHHDLNVVVGTFAMISSLQQVKRTQTSSETSGRFGAMECRAT